MAQVTNLCYRTAGCKRVLSLSKGLRYQMNGSDASCVLVTCQRTASHNVVARGLVPRQPQRSARACPPPLHPVLPLLSLGETSVLDCWLFLGDEKDMLPSKLDKICSCQSP